MQYSLFKKSLGVKYVLQKQNLKEKRKCLIGLEKRQVYLALINMYCFEFAVILKEWRVIDLVCMKHILTILT